jgi:hypothetical protein
LDVLARAGYVALAHHQFFVAVHGHFVNPALSTQGCGVTSGSRVVLLQRRKPDGSRARLFLESLAATPRAAAARPADAAWARSKSERGRITDRSFLRFEMAKRSKQIYAEIQREQESKRKTRKTDNNETVIEFQSEISEAPLPAPSARGVMT